MSRNQRTVLQPVAYLRRAEIRPSPNLPRQALGKSHIVSVWKLRAGTRVAYLAFLFDPLLEGLSVRKRKSAGDDSADPSRLQLDNTEIRPPVDADKAQPGQIQWDRAAM